MSREKFKSIKIEFDLSIMSSEEVKQLKNIVVHQQQYENAGTLRAYEKHLLNIKKV